MAPLKQHTTIALDATILDHYAGRYGFSPEMILSVVREGDHVIVKEGAENHEMFPETDHDFFSKTTDDEITFEVDGQGRVTQMVLRTGGRTIPIKRI